MPVVVDYQDKFLHVAAYVIMGLFATVFFSTYFSTKNCFTFVVLFGIVFGISDEWHQSFVPGRSVDILDWVADVVGICLGYFITRYYMFIISKPKKQSKL